MRRTFLEVRIECKLETGVVLFELVFNELSANDEFGCAFDFTSHVSNILNVGHVSP